MLISKRYMGGELSVQKAEGADVKPRTFDGPEIIPVTGPVTNAAQLDHEYYSRLEQIFQNDEVDVFTFDIAELNNGNVVYPEIMVKPDGTDPIAQNVALLRKIKDEIFTDDKFIEDEVTRGRVKNLYFKKINDRLALWELASLYRDSKDLNGNLLSEDAKKAKQKQLNTFLFGQPNKELFQALSSDMVSRVANIDSKGSSIIDNAKTAVLQTLKSFAPKKYDFPLNADEMGKIKESFVRRYVANVEIPQGKTSFTPGEASSILRDNLDKNGLQGYRVVANPDRTNMSVSHKTGSYTDQNGTTVTYEGTLTIAGQSDLEAIRFSSLIGHEFVHGQTRQSGKNSPLKLLETGTAGYIQDEEGIAEISGDTYRGFDKGDIDEYYSYVAIGLAYRLDDNNPSFGFNEMKAFYENIQTLQIFVEGKTDVEAKATAEKTSMGQTLRKYRGLGNKNSGSNSLGFCMAKDIVYTHGIIGIAKWIKEHPNADLRVLVAKGKSSLTNTDVLALQSLGRIKLSQGEEQKYIDGDFVTIRGFRHQMQTVLPKDPVST